MTKAEIKAVLTGALQDGVALYWQFPPSGTGRCLVWGETGPAGGPAADNRPGERGMKGMVELYTTLEEDPLFATVEEALRGARLVFSWESSGYDRDAGQAPLALGQPVRAFERVQTAERGVCK